MILTLTIATIILLILSSWIILHHHRRCHRLSTFLHNPTIGTTVTVQLVSDANDDDPDRIPGVLWTGSGQVVAIEPSQGMVQLDLWTTTADGTHRRRSWFYLSDVVAVLDE